MKKYALEIETPKVVKGLSSMNFTVKKWTEIALSDDKQALEDYKKTYSNLAKTRIVERYGVPQ